MEEVLDIFRLTSMSAQPLQDVVGAADIVEGGICCGAFIGFLFISWFPRVNSWLERQRGVWSEGKSHVPLKIQRRRKSGSDTCSLRTARVLEMKFFAAPEVPGSN